VFGCHRGTHPNPVSQGGNNPVGATTGPGRLVGATRMGCLPFASDPTRPTTIPARAGLPPSSGGFSSQSTVSRSVGSVVLRRVMTVRERWARSRPGWPTRRSGRPSGSAGSGHVDTAGVPRAKPSAQGSGNRPLQPVSRQLSPFRRASGSVGACPPERGARPTSGPNTSRQCTTDPGDGPHQHQHPVPAAGAVAMRPTTPSPQRISNSSLRHRRSATSCTRPAQPTTPPRPAPPP